jgi:glutamyl/glutaminyl-tRNA synthetase
MGCAVANHIARLGWSPRGRRALCTLPELAERFEPDRISSRPIGVDRSQLDWYSRRCLARMAPAELAALLAVRWERAYGCADRAAGTGMAPAEWRRALAALVAGEAHTLAEAVRLTRFAFVERVVPSPEASELLIRAFAPPVLRTFADGITALPGSAFDEIDAFVSELRLRYRERLGVRSRDVMHVLRAALTGRVDGPCLVAACQVLGRERCAMRASQALGGDCG